MEVALAEAKARLSELVERATQGETICITRRGRPVAHVIGIARKKKPVDVDKLKAFTDSLPYSEQSAADLVRQMRDEGY